MFEVKNFDNWKEDTDSGKFGSGASEKVWLVNPETNEKGIFKFPKIKTDGTITGEYWAEKLASEIGKLIDVKCARVDIGTYKGRLGSMSYNILKENETLNEGVTYIQVKYPFYNKKTLINEYNNEKYSLQMINNSLSDEGFEYILKMVLFDALIGNSDRHSSNWGIILHIDTYKGFETRFCPLYDNGSSLCSYENPENVEIYFKDKMKFDSLIKTKSKSLIGWKDISKIRHFELIKYVREEYYNRTEKYVRIIKDNITEESIQGILDNFSNDIINSNMKKLLLKFLIKRKDIILDIYNMKDEV